MDTLTDAVPVTILTGFLGAGKTTLLNRILNGDHGLKVAVLVNDFGAINIDADLVVGVDEDVISLANGCVCCTIRDDLVETVLSTINRPEAPEYILLEASGVADPSGIAMTFVDQGLRDRLRLDSIACVIDADQVFANPELPELTQLKLRQVAFSDLVVLNKVSLAGPDRTREVREWIDATFRRLRVVETDNCVVPLEILLSVGRFDVTEAEAGLRGLHNVECADDGCSDVGHASGPGFTSWSHQSDGVLSLEALRKGIAKLPGSIYRVKGVIDTDELPGQRTVLQVVGRRIDVAPGGPWGERAPGNRVVAIGTENDGFGSLEEVLQACRT